MAFPIIPIAIAVNMVGSSMCLGWYLGLSKEQQDEVDRAANGIAQRTFGKALNMLSRSQAEAAIGEARKHT